MYFFCNVNVLKSTSLIHRCQPFQNPLLRFCPIENLTLIHRQIKKAVNTTTHLKKTVTNVHGPKARRMLFSVRQAYAIKFPERVPKLCTCTCTHFCVVLPRSEVISGHIRIYCEEFEIELWKITWRCRKQEHDLRYTLVHALSSV